MASAQSDLVLLRRFADRGDHEAFAQLARRHAGLVFATCRRVLGDRERAEEVSQEIFFRLVQSPQAVTQSVAGWLHRTATRLAIDVARSDASRRRREVKYAREQVSDTPRWVELSPIIDECLAELDEPVRSLLVEHFLAGRTQTEIAEGEGVSVSTVSRRIRSGVKLLRERLAQRGVTAGAAALAVLLAENAAEAAPPIVIAEAGKMMLVSAGVGTGVGAGAAGSGMALGWTTVAAIALSAIMFLAGLAAVGYTLWQSYESVSPHAAPPAVLTEPQ